MDNSIRFRDMTTGPAAYISLYSSVVPSWTARSQKPLHAMDLRSAILHRLLRDRASGASIHAFAAVLTFGDKEVGKLVGLVLPENPERARLGRRANAVRAGLRIALRVVDR